MRNNRNKSTLRTKFACMLAVKKLNLNNNKKKLKRGEFVAFFKLAFANQGHHLLEGNKY